MPAPTCHADFYSDQTISDPVRLYNEMHNLGPVVWLEQNKLHAICGHKELVAALRDHQTFSSARGVSINENVNKIIVGSTLNSDPPQHDATRSITFQPLSPKALPAIREAIEDEAIRIVEHVLKKKEFDAGYWKMHRMQHG